MQNKKALLWLLFFLLLLLLCLVRPVSAQSLNETNTPILSQESIETMPQPWQDFDIAWEKLKAELMASDLDYQALLIGLIDLQIEVRELKLSYSELMTLYGKSEQAIKETQIARDIAIESKNNWKRTAFIGTGSALIAGFILGILLK